MTKSVITLHTSDTIETALRKIVENQISGAPIIKGTHELVSVATEYRLLLLAAKGHHRKKIQELIKEFPQELKTVTQQETFLEVFKKFKDNKVRRLMVVDHNFNLLGIVSRRNLLKIFIEQFDANPEVLNL